MREKKLFVRSLGLVSFEEATALQRGLGSCEDDYLLFLEHPDVFTCGSGTKDHHLKEIKSTDADVVEVDRGGSVTFHGHGQLVGYPIVSIETSSGDLRGSLRYINKLQEVLIEALKIIGVESTSKDGFTGVWIDRGKNLIESQRYSKIAAIGVKVAKGRTRHGFALNVSTDLDNFGRIIPCGIENYGVTSLHDLGLTHVTIDEVQETITKTFVEHFDYDFLDIASTESVQTPGIAISNNSSQAQSFDIGFTEEKNAKLEDSNLDRFSIQSVSAEQPSLRLLGRLSKAGVAVDFSKNRLDRPEWMKNKFNGGQNYHELKNLSKDLKLHTVCEEAGCPNIYECWQDKTATFMILGERCTRACSFCLVDTRKPKEVDREEPKNVALAVSKLGLDFAVITCVARDDLSDDGANQFAKTVKCIRETSPGTQIELLISDCKGKSSSLDIIFNEKPDILNHNIETVARLQKAVRPSASYARSLSVLSRAKDKGLKTKTGIIVGMGESNSEVLQTLRDLKNIDVDIVTIGQYLQPTPRHLPVDRFVKPQEFEIFKEFGENLGISHIESGPLVRSSFHAKSAAKAAK